MPISESLSFIFNNQLSTDFGVINCHVDTSGMYEESFISNREIKEIVTRYNDKPHYIQTKPLPRILNLSIAFNEFFDEDKLRSVKRWLTQDSYCTMSFESLPDYIFYCILTDSTPLLHNGTQGYINCQFRCSDPYIYSPTYLGTLYDLSSNPTNGTNITFSNNGDIPIQPQLSLLKVGNGDISIQNLSNGGAEFKLTSLTDNEDLFIDNENEEITSSIPDTYRLNNLTGDFITMIWGINNLLVKGNCKLQFRYQFKLL